MERAVIHRDALKHLRGTISRAVSLMRDKVHASDVTEAIFRVYVEPVIQHYNPITSPLAEHYGCRLFRARKCSAQTPFTNVKDLLNPPVPTGRAFVNESMPILYASTSMQTCLSETDPKIGDVINVIGLNYAEIRDRSFWFVGQLASFYRSTEPSHYVADRSELHLPAYFQEEARFSFLFQDALFNEVFSRFASPDDGYALNRLLIAAIQRKLAPITELAGVIFLSIKDAPGVNFAIFGDAIHQLSIGQLNLIEITDVDEYGFVAYKLLQNGAHDNGSIRWRDV